MPLMGLATMNACVHVVMYAYYLAAAMRLQPPLWWLGLGLGMGLTVTRLYPTPNPKLNY